MVFEEIETIAALSPQARLERAKKHTTLPAPKAIRQRSNMMLNPLNLKHLNRIDRLDTDTVTLNLEDAIAPSRKREALYNIALFVSHLKARQSTIVVRLNPIGAGGEEEIAFLRDFPIDAVRIPKVRSHTEIEKALSLLNEEKELHISLETKEGLEKLSGFRYERLTTANLGILDLLGDLALPQSLVTHDNPTVHYLLAKFLVDAKTAGITPIGFMYQAYADEAGFRRWCKLEKKMGYRGKACMGPKQVAIANAIFDDDAESIARARYIKRRFEEEAARNNNGFWDEKLSLFIDEPIYRDALNTLKGRE